MTIRITHVTDFHVRAEPDDRFAGVDTFATLERVLRAVARESPAPDVVVATGDLSDDGSPASYRRIRNALLTLGAPVSCVPGNHDDLAAMHAHLAGGEIAVMQRVVIGRWQLVPLDSQVPGKGHGHAGAEALAALDALLAAEPERHALLALHHAPMTGCPEPDCRLDDAGELTALLERHPSVRAVLTGHTHWTEDNRAGGARMLVAPATSLQIEHPSEAAGTGKSFWDTHRADRDRLGYLRLELGDDGSVASETVWV